LSYLVLARKWRPQGFDEIIGQDTITRTLRNAISKGRVAHAFLFSGPRGVGKTTMARVLAKALNCDKGPTVTPCGECSACREITAGNSLDVLEIDGASNTSVDDIRELREAVRYLPGSSRHKIYIIDEVHMLSISAFNALLKTLEEPPEHVIFIFATTEPHKVPATIQSRCLRFDFQRIPLKLIQDRLKQVCQGEGIKVTDPGLLFIAREAEGSMRDALSFLDQITSFAGLEIGEQEVIQTLGILERKYLYDLSRAVLTADVRKSLEIVNEVFQHGYDMKRFSRELLEHFRNLAVVKYAESPDRLMDLPENEIEELTSQTREISAETLQMFFDLLVRGEEEVARAREPKLILEMTLASMSHLKPVVPLEDILKNLNRIEGQIRGSQPSTGAQTGDSNNLGGANLSSGSLGFAPKSTEPVPGPAVSGKVRWEKFLKDMGEKNAKLAAMLGHGSYKGISEGPGGSEGQVRVAFPKASFYFEQLASKANIKELKELTEAFFGKGYRLICEQEDDSEGFGGAEASPGRNIKNEADELRREALENPVVQEVLDIFQGEIKEIKIK